MGAADAVKQRCLSRPVGANHNPAFARFDVKGHIVDGMDSAKALVNPAQ
jgi:hypothetical protein